MHASFKATKATLAALAILVWAIPGQARITRLVVEHTETLGSRWIPETHRTCLWRTRPQAPAQRDHYRSPIRAA